MKTYRSFRPKTEFVERVTVTIPYAMKRFIMDQLYADGYRVLSANAPRLRGSNKIALDLQKVRIIAERPFVGKYSEV